MTGSKTAINPLRDSIHIKTPGRICLFGDHQDYLGLPVIACAIDRFVFLSSELNTTPFFHIRMPDIGKKRRIPVSEAFGTLQKGDHFAAALRVVRRYGCYPDRGFDIEIKSTLPINAGVSSSSAVVVAWTHFLLTAFGCHREVTPALIAQLAYEAEVVEQHSPGGKMDQYTVSLGGLIAIETGTQFSYQHIEKPLEGLVLGISGIPKQTIGLLGTLREKVQMAISEVKNNFPTFNIKNARLEDLDSLSKFVSPNLFPFLKAAISNHSITQKAMIEFQNPSPDEKVLGSLMSEHHAVLRHLLQITVPRIDAMIDAAIEAGAYGSKIVGSGGGGSIVALAPTRKTETIREAIFSAGAVDAYAVQVVNGSQKIKKS